MESRVGVGGGSPAIGGSGGSQSMSERMKHCCDSSGRTYGEESGSERMRERHCYDPSWKTYGEESGRFGTCCGGCIE